ncbi:putative ORFan [Tupanvirus deep ocean]|uniref:ORFan n=2 Tax=Tupanvirus TaxID=2094720 RepID=A0AC62A6Y0_9VIRU|nr:putative ORFan [Tupanvirus deep ocean]QKU33509.1 putative ORFan [Tupanvirus deep ocean]
MFIIHINTILIILINLNMQVIDTKTVNCLLISPDGRFENFRLAFDLHVDQKLIKLENEDPKKIIINNMKTKCGCQYYIANIAKAILPAETFYYAFFEDACELNGKKFNKIGTHMINNLYNSDSQYNKSTSNFKCYGNCYILHIDQDFNLHDVGATTFINLYNKVHTSKGVDERYHTERLYTKPNKKKIYNYNDYLKSKKGKCITM